MERNNGRKKKTVLFITVLIAVILIAVLVYYQNAVYCTFQNLTAYKTDIDPYEEWDGGISYEGVAYAYDSDNQYLDLYVPDHSEGNEPKLFVLVHGGGFIYNDSQSKQAALMYHYFRDQGYACATINYRLAQEAEFPGALSDVKAAIRYLRSHADEYGYDAETIALWGESAGGYLATAAAVTDDDEFTDIRYIGQDEDEAKGIEVSARVNVLVDYYGAVDLRNKSEDWKKLRIPGIVVSIANSWLHTDVLDGYSDVESYWLRKETSSMSVEELDYSDPMYYAKKNLPQMDDLSVWIAHGDCDITVPILQSERLYELCAGILGEDRVHFEVIHNAGHAGDIMYSDEELYKVKTFLDERL
ncbi:MAG: alpha/beta hydrolase [Lachnospiraceae bacterium]|nr:alpha/beta hydrolase [Lachnospiraceae bacterium]